MGYFTSLVAFARRQADGGDFVLFTVGNWDFRQSLLNWLHAVISVGLKSFVVVALDRELYEFLRVRGIPCYFASHLEAVVSTFGKDRVMVHNIWGYRYLAIWALLSEGVDVLQCDADAIILQDPRTYLAGIHSDIVAQRGNFPRPSLRAWGATMCFGFVLYRSTEATLALFELSLPRFHRLRDDQVAFQLALLNCTTLIWNNGRIRPVTRVTRRDDPERGSSTDLGTTENPITASGNHLRVALLPLRDFPRHCGTRYGSPEQLPSVKLAHCLSGNDGHKKVLTSEVLGFNFLKEDWELQLPALGESSEQFLRRIGNGKHPATRGDKPAEGAA